MPTAYSYLRFSTPDQGKGDSERRQLQLALDFIEEHNRKQPANSLVLDTELKLVDRGKSAFTGRNTTAGEFGKFLALVLAGEIEPGSYLLVENLDRLSRQAPLDAVSQLTMLVNRSITVVSLSDNQVFSEATLRGENGTWNLMAAVMAAHRAHEESVMKSKRVAAAWANKRKRIQDGVRLTRWMPFWIDPETRTVLKEKAELVRTIYALYLSGRGLTSLTKHLNEIGLQTPSGKSDQWHQSAVRKILTNKGVIGTLVTRAGTGDAEEYPGYYPPIIDEATFLAASNMISSGGRQRAKTVPHPLSGLLVCDCEKRSSIVRVNKGNYTYLVCTRAKNGAKCPFKYRAVRYEDVMAAMKRELPTLTQLAPSTENHETILGHYEAAVWPLIEQAQAAYRDYLDLRTALAKERYLFIDQELQKAKAEHARLVAENKQVNAEFISRLLAQPDLESNAWVRQIFHTGTLDLVGRTLTVEYRNGTSHRFPLDDPHAGDNPL
jgi:DNA invertase Pin-like site-specific DNA recombinase